MRRKGTGRGTGTDEQVRTDPGTGTDSGAGTGKRKTGRPKGSKSGYTVSEKALAQRQKNAEAINMAGPFDGEAYSYNARNIEHVLHIQEIALRADRNDLVSLRSCFIAYLQLCQQDGFKPGNLAACAAMGISHDTLSVWSRGQDKDKRELANLVRNTCGIIREGMIADQKINPVIGIFWQRNFDGLRNDTEQVQAIQQETTETEGKTSNDYIKQYGKLPED